MCQANFALEFPYKKSEEEGIDDSDVAKPEGRKFETPGIVRDGSKSTEKKSVYEKGYHVTEAVAITRSEQPASLFSRIHSSREKGYVSTNAVTFEAIGECVSLFRKATYIMDRGYDDNKMFLKPEELKQDSDSSHRIKASFDFMSATLL